METSIVEFNPTGESARRARMKMSYQALSRVLRGNFFPIEHCTAPADLLITGIQSDIDAHFCWVEYYSGSLPETDLSQPLPETAPWEYIPADSWKKVLALSEKINAMVEESVSIDADQFISCRELSEMLQEIINGKINPS